MAADEIAIAIAFCDCCCDNLNGDNDAGGYECSPLSVDDSSSSVDDSSVKIAFGEYRECDCRKCLDVGIEGIDVIDLSRSRSGRMVTPFGLNKCS